MDMALAIRQRLTAIEVAEHYGFRVGRAGFIPCPFHHGDNTASLKLYDGESGWHCFGCNKGGSVIDFVMQLYGLNFKQAVMRINADFRLGLAAEKPSRNEYSKVLEERRRERELQEKSEEMFRKIAQELHYQKEIVETFQPQRIGDDAYYHPFYIEAIKRIPTLEHWLDDYIEKGGGMEWINSLSSPGTII